MTALDLLSVARRRGIVLAPRGDRLGYDSPPGALTPDLRSALAQHKAELLALLTADPFAARWGPALDDDVPGIDLPANSWRWVVAGWPHDRWVAWRRRSGELEPLNATAEMIRTAEHLAFIELSRSPEPHP
jgi:hypothetical protein